MSADEDHTRGRENKKETNIEASPSRRNWLRIGLRLGAILALLGAAPIAKVLTDPGPEPATNSSGESTTSTRNQKMPPPVSSGFPVILVSNINDIQRDGGQISFNYPLEETPNILVKLGQKVVGGVGPDEDIVAFSEICQHLGCIWRFVGSGESPSCNSSYKTPRSIGYCCCHGSVYDLANAGKVISGPSPKQVPQVLLSFDSSTGDIFAVGMSGPTIFGFENDLQGGTVVS